MAGDWFSALPDVIVAALAGSNARAQIKLGVSPPTCHDAWSREETRATAYMALEGPEAAGGVLNPSSPCWSMTAVIRTRRPGRPAGSAPAAYRS
jgi:hypothetical protein